eukprot:gene7866-9234_t
MLLSRQRISLVALLVAVSLVALVSLDNVQAQKVLNVALMYPLGDNDPMEKQYKKSFDIAVADWTPKFQAANVTLNVKHYDEYETITNSIDIVQVFKAHGVVGPAYSGASSKACLILGAYGVPSISYYATATGLSNTANYETFNRVIPDDLQQVQSILALVKKQGWSRISCVHTNEDYGTGGANILVREANAVSVTVNTIQSLDQVTSSFTPPNEKYDVLFDNLDQAKARVIVMYMIFPDDCTTLWTKARERGYMRSGIVWIVTDGCAELADGLGYTGLIGFFPTYNVSGLSTLETKLNDPAFYKGSSFAYDATNAMLENFGNMVNQDQDFTDGSLVLTSLRNHSYQGVTGTVEFSETGDRVDGSFVIFNYFNGKFNQVGSASANQVDMQGHKLIFGDGTTDIPSDYEVVKYNVTLNSVLGAITGACILFVLFIGTALCGLTSIFTLLPSPNRHLCISFPWLLGLGYVILFGTLFTKTWRTWRLFYNARKFKIIKISNKFMFVVVGSFVLLECVFMVLWTAIDRPVATAKPIYKSGQAQLQCTTDSEAWWFVFVFYKVFYVIVGVFLAFKTRDVVDSLNESKPITLSLYNLTFVMMVAIPIGFIMSDYPTAVIVIEVVAVILSFTATVGLLFLPKVWLIISGQQKSIDTRDSSYNSNGMSSDAAEMRDRNASVASRGSIRVPSSKASQIQTQIANAGGGVTYVGGQPLPTQQQSPPPPPSSPTMSATLSSEFEEPKE